MGGTMKNIVITGINEIVVEDHPIPQCTPDKILVRIEACAICTWEQRVYKGINKVEYPFIGGHEMSGHIVELGSNINTTQWHVGDKVVCGVIASCDNCTQCKSGNSQACQHFDHSIQQPGMPYHGMGGMSSYYLVDPKKCFHYDGISALQASLTEPVTCVLHAIEAANIQLGDTVVVIGCGIMGQLNALLAAKRGAMVIVSDVDKTRTDLAKSLGASYTVNPKEKPLYDQIRDITKGAMADVVIDTTPVISVVDDAISILANCGKLVFYSSFHPDVPTSFSPNLLHTNNLQFIGSANSNEHDFISATKMLSHHVIDVSPFISAVYPVDQAKQAFDAACQGGKYRVIITF